MSRRNREIGTLLPNNEQPAQALHLPHREGCAALRIVLVTVPHVSRSCEHFPDGFDPHLLRNTLTSSPARLTSGSRSVVPGGPYDRWLRPEVLCRSRGVSPDLSPLGLERRWQEGWHYCDRPDHSAQTKDSKEHSDTECQNDTRPPNNRKRFELIPGHKLFTPAGVGGGAQTRRAEIVTWGSSHD